MLSAKPKRVTIEANEMLTSPSEGVTIILDEKQPLIWEILIKGPKNTPYEGGTFRLSCVFPENYPFKVPKMKFITKIYHPSVESDGELCLGYENDWVATKKVSGICQLIISTMTDPNLVCFGSYLNRCCVECWLHIAIYKELITNKEQFIKNAQEWTQKYAC